ncbi:NADH-quinone oxidoreductase subunit NuoN [Streptomyces californicus]
MVAVFTFAERRLDPGSGGNHVDSFAAQPGSVPGGEGEKAAVRAGFTTTEVFPLLLFSVAGLLVFPAANDLLTLFIALEVFSLPLYLLCAVARRKRLMSQEAAVKYFLLGAFSSAFMLFGIALVYGYSGSLSVRPDRQGRRRLGPGDRPGPRRHHGQRRAAAHRRRDDPDRPALQGRRGPVPQWTPDVYQGAPTPVTGFMAAATKVAASAPCCACCTWRCRASPGTCGRSCGRWPWSRCGRSDGRDHPGRIERAGLLLDRARGLHPRRRHRGQPGGRLLGPLLPAGLSFVTVGAFAVVTLVRDAGGEATHLSKWAGLGRRSPLVAAVFAVFLLAFAGIPLTSGFSGKFAVFKAAAEGGAGALVVVGVISWPSRRSSTSA